MIDLVKANEGLKGIDVKGKEYVEVFQRVKAFRNVCPNGTIATELVSNENGVCVFKASVMDDEGKLLATGTAYEKENSSFINKTSYIENCETSAVGRALGFLGIGIDTSIASVEEVVNAMNGQKKEDSELAKKKAKQYENPIPKCANCGEVITKHGTYSADTIAKNTMNKYFKPLCWDCGLKMKEITTFQDAIPENPSL